MDAPQYIWDLLEKELRNSHVALLKNVATKYNLNFEELEAEFLSKSLQLTPNKQTPIEIRHKARPKQEPPDTCRCYARIYNRGKGGQCSRMRIEGEDFCRQHLPERKHGDIREKVPREIFPKQKRFLFI